MKPIVLLIRDGWGIRKQRKGNAPALAKTPVTDKLLKKYPKAVLQAAEEGVGLPKGYQGNSEVGHLTIGSGRIIHQALERINKSIRDKSFYKNKALNSLMNNIKKKRSSLHVMGLVQDQGVHAHISHLYAILKLAKKKRLKDVIVHAFTDGRDTPPKSAEAYLSRLQRAFGRIGIGRLGTIIGRYYAMDRDKRWIRTELAYQAITHARGVEEESWRSAISDAYKREQTDEFIRPRIIKGYKGLKKGDGIIFFNYRFDRARQLTRALIDKDFQGFHTDHPNISMVTMTEYYDNIPCGVAFPPVEVTNHLGRVISRNKLRQLRISETEKYAHVTFFFNGLKEEPDRLEERILIHSPKVATYDQKPEMSVFKITKTLLKELDKKSHDVIVVNLVNGDMVGHTGNLKAAKIAVKAIDGCVGKIRDKVLEKGGILLVAADHGNCEEMIGKHQTSHTLNPVSNRKLKLKKKTGDLSCIAPTILSLLGIQKPKEMSGVSLI